MLTVVLIVAGVFALAFVLAVSLCAAAGRADRALEQARPEAPEGSLQARVDALRELGDAADAMLWPAPKPGPRRRKGGGWVSS